MPGGLIDGRDPLLLEADIGPHTQAVIGEGYQTHGVAVQGVQDGEGHKSDIKIISNIALRDDSI